MGLAQARPNYFFFLIYFFFWGGGGGSDFDWVCSVASASVTIIREKESDETLPEIPTMYFTNNLVNCNWLQAMVHQYLFIVTVVNCSHR